jgi:hypothetical protein
MLQWLAPGAPVILTGACPDGLGHHGLFGPGGRLCRVPAPKRFLGDRDMWVFAPGIAAEDVRAVFAEAYPTYSRWELLVSALSRKLRTDARVGLVPCGPLQVAQHREISRSIDERGGATGSES